MILHADPGLSEGRILFSNGMEFLRSADWGLLTFINSTLSHPWLDAFFPVFTDLHKTWFGAVLVAIVLWWFWRVYRARGLALFFMLFVVIGITDASSTQLLKHTFQRSRPFNTEGVVVVQKAPAHSNSFPSNHSANSFAAATFISAFVPALSGLFYAVAALVAYSRVYCGVHFPSDVLGGALWGILIGWIGVKLTQALLMRNRKVER